MNGKLQIIPTILATTEKEYKSKLQEIENTPEFEGGWVQIDLMDNKFVQNTSITPEVIARYPTSLKKEAHLMVEYPESWIDELVNLKVERIIFPLEDKEGITERVTHIKNHGLEVGLALNPETPVAKLEPYIGTIDLVLILSVHPGFGGQKFLPGVLPKIKEAAALKERGRFLIEVDGGINKEVAGRAAAEGADILVVGSHLFDGNVSENLEKIWQAVFAGKSSGH
ncbi:MAG: ribulose-phosphate 3-epimerase [bacterium]|nr:ribulose-phosphate 3-epimerase [bacterium]